MNKKIKIIELLNKIANGEEVPKEIIVEKGKYRWDEIKKTYYEPEGLTTLGNAFVLDRMLNNEVEILEDNTKEIEELDTDIHIDSFMDAEFNFNKIAQEINKLGKVIKELIQLQLLT